MDGREGISGGSRDRVRPVTGMVTVEERVRFLSEDGCRAVCVSCCRKEMICVYL